jgi:hypothetical protein
VEREYKEKRGTPKEGKIENKIKTIRKKNRLSYRRLRADVLESDDEALLQQLQRVCLA